MYTYIAEVATVHTWCIHKPALYFFCMWAPWTWGGGSSGEGGHTVICYHIIACRATLLQVELQHAITEVNWKCDASCCHVADMCWLTTSQRCYLGLITKRTSVLSQNGNISRPQIFKKRKKDQRSNTLLHIILFNILLLQQISLLQVQLHITVHYCNIPSQVSRYQSCRLYTTHLMFLLWRESKGKNNGSVASTGMSTFTSAANQQTEQCFLPPFLRGIFLYYTTLHYALIATLCMNNDPLSVGHHFSSWDAKRTLQNSLQSLFCISAQFKPRCWKRGHFQCRACLLQVSSLEVWTATLSSSLDTGSRTSGQWTLACKAGLCHQWRSPALHQRSKCHQRCQWSSRWVLWKTTSSARWRNFHLRLPRKEKKKWHTGSYSRTVRWHKNSLSIQAGSTTPVV